MTAVAVAAHRTLLTGAHARTIAHDERELDRGDWFACDFPERPFEQGHTVFFSDCYPCRLALRAAVVNAYAHVERCADAVELRTLAELSAVPHAQLPPKVEGEHRWIATAAYVVSVDVVEAADDADRVKYLDRENLMHLALGCWDCEQPLGVIKAGSRCPGVPS